MKTLGIVGGGQLGRLLAEAARTLGIRTVVLDPMPECPASAVADKHVVGDFKDHAAVVAFAQECNVMTFEIESANADALHELVERGFPVHPTPGTLAFIKDKLVQKDFLTKHGIPVAPYRVVMDAADAKEAGNVLGYPFVLKARSGGYDGRGNALVRDETELSAALEKLGGNLYAEGFVEFQKELAVVAVRTTLGDIRTYPVVETVHEDHICNIVTMPAPVADEVQKKAEALAHTVLASFEGAGVFAIEMFLAGDEVLVNEIAPRVHNSGHLTIEACEASQFENHVRAVMGMELGSTAMKVPAAAMVNILGNRTGPAEATGVEDAESLGEVVVHIYGKKETKPARKMGHITATGASLTEALQKAQEARKRVSI